PLAPPVGQLARIVLVARPLDRLAAPLEQREVLARAPRAAAPQPLQRARRVESAVHPRRAEEHDRVLDVLGLEPPQRLEVFGEDPERARFVALEELRVHVRQRLVGHPRKTVSLPYEPTLECL